MKTKIFTFFVAWAVAGMTTAQVQSVMTGINVKDIQIKSIDVEKTIDREKFTAESYANRFAKKANAANANYGGIDYYSVDGMMHAGITIDGDMHYPMLLLPYQDVTVWKNRIMPMATASWTITEAPTTWNINGQTVENSQTCEVMYEPMFIAATPITNDHYVLLNNADVEIKGYQYGSNQSSQFVVCAAGADQVTDGGYMPMTLCGMYCDPLLNDGEDQDYYMVGAGSYGDYSIGTGLNIEGKSMDTIGSIVRNVSPMKVEQIDIMVCDKTNQGGAYMFPEGASVKVEIFPADLTAGLIDTTEPLYTTTMTIEDYTEFNVQLGMISAKFYEEDIFSGLMQVPIVIEGDFYVQFTNFNESGCHFGIMSDYTTPGGTTLYTWDGEFTTLWTDGGVNMLINYDGYWPTIMYGGDSDILVAPVEGGAAMDGEYEAVALLTNVLDFEKWGEVEAPEWIEVVLDESVLSTDGYVIASFEVAPLPEGETGRQGIVTVDADGFKLDIVINQGDVPTTPTPIGITYELNGGITNDYGWMSKNDMFDACMTDALGSSLDKTLDEFKSSTTPYVDLFKSLTHIDCQHILDSERWDWLEEYLIAVQNEQLAVTLTEGVTSYNWLYAIAAFFFESEYSTSADYSEAGKDKAYIPYWKHGYDNPTNPTEEFTLNAPYKENYLFGGWYTSADFSGAKVTTVNASTTDTLYARWLEPTPTIADVKAMENNIKTKVSGVATHIQDRYVFIQDHTGGLSLFMSNPPTFTIGQQIVVEGHTSIVGGAPQLNMVTEISAEDGIMPDPIEFDGLASLVEDTQLKYFGLLVKVTGLIITGYTSDNYPIVSDWGSSATCYNMIINPNKFPLGTEVTLTAIASYNNGFQFEGDITGFEIANSPTPPCEDVYSEFSATACDSYAWNGQTYTQSGDYTYTTTAANGCDSIVTLHLTINKAKHKEVNHTACDSYAWNGQTYTESGDYTYTTTAANGCDSIVTLHLTINKAKHKEVYHTACNSYAWNGQTYTTSGDYTYTTTAANGCDSVVTLHLTINNIIHAEEHITACDSYAWNGQTYTQSGDYTYTTTAANGCDSIVTLHLTLNQSEVGEIDHVTISYGETYTWNGQTYSEKGEYSVTLSNAAGCDSVATLDLIVKNEEHISICYGDTYLWEMDGNEYEESGTYYSDKGSVLFILVLTVYPPTEDTEEYASIPMGSTYWWNEMEYTEAGTYTETAFDENGCEYTATLHLTVTEAEEASRTEEAICYGDSYLWDIDGEWYDESGTYYAYDEEGKHVLELTVYPPTEDTEEYVTITYGESYWWNDIEYTEAGTYTETVFDENDCEYTATLHLTVEEDNACYLSTCNNQEFYPEGGCDWYALDLTEFPDGEDMRIIVTDEFGGDLVGCNIILYEMPNEASLTIFEINETLEHKQMIDTIVPRSMFEQYEKIYFQISVDGPLNILFTSFAPCLSENSTPYIWGTEILTDSEEANLTYSIDLEQLRVQQQSVELTITNSSHKDGALWMFDYGHNCSNNLCFEDPDLLFGYMATPTASTVKWIIDFAQFNETDTDCYFAAGLFDDENFFEMEPLDGSWMMNPVESHAALCQDATSIQPGWIYLLPANEQQYYLLDSADLHTTDTTRSVVLTIENLSNNPIECTYSTGICGFEQVMPTITLSAHESKIVPIQFASMLTLMEYKGDYNLSIHATGDISMKCTIDGITSEQQHQICYTSSDGNIITPYNTNAFGANIVNNTYTNGQGIMIFDAPVTNIGNAAFYSCNTLTSIQIPNTVLAIRQDAFTGCNQLTKLTIPASVMTIDRSFISAQYIEVITVDTANLTYDSRNNCNAIIETASNRLLKGCKNTIIPNTVEIIGNSAFADCTTLTQIVIPDGVSTIEYGAFNGCSAVKTIRSFSTTPPTLEGTVFGSLPSTTPVYVPCSSLELYRAVEHWGSIFSNIICASVTICHGESYTWDINGKTYTESGTYTHTTNYGEETLYLTVLPEVPITEIVERICYGNTYPLGGEVYAATGDYTITLTDQFGCDSVINLHLTVLPDATTEELKATISSEEIPYEWRGNTYTTTGRYTEVEQYAQTNCDSVIHILDLIVLTTGNYEEKYDTICQSQLPYIWYNQSLTTSGKYSYTEQYVGSSIDSIQHILNLTIMETNYSDEYRTICYGETYTWNGQTYSTEGEYTIVLTNTNGCDSIATLHLTILPEIPATEEYATICYGETLTWNGILCKYTDSYSAILTSILTGCDSTAVLHLTVLPPSTTETENVNLSVNELPYNWRDKWYNKTGVYYDTVSYSQFACDSVIYKLTLTINTTNMCGNNLIWEYAANGGVLNIKGSGAMYDDPHLLSYRTQDGYPENIKHVSLPEGLTHIGNVAFADCANLTSINIPSSVTSIGDGAFSWTGLQSITIPASVTELGEQVFEACNNLRTILYEGNPTTIANQSIHPLIGCVHLDTVIAPAALWHCTNADPALEARYGVPHKARYIEVTDGELTNQAIKYIAQNATALEVLDLTNTTNTTLPYGALYNSYLLTQLYLPAYIETLPESMIEGGSRLSEITIPATVTEIGNYAFAGCVNIWRMTVEAMTPPKVYENTFDGISRSISVLVPAGSEQAYREAEYWREFFIDNTNSPLPISNCQKILREDQILILREGKVYTTMGQLITIDK